MKILKNSRIVYNVTTQIDIAYAAEWMEWMKEEHLPAVLATGCFIDAAIFRLLEVDDSLSHTYAVQYYAADKQAYEAYISAHADALRQQTVQKWEGKMVAFRSVLQLQA